ncbi:MAG: hypothetical protein HY063_05230 [Bacteroidetes bacterium]|nr:hypothetical protein [Bacteroidota bacterium]
MKKENTLNPEQRKEIMDWLTSEIQKLSKDINRYHATSHYSRAERAEGARDAYYKCINELMKLQDPTNANQ